jgi:hypothetical protein
MIPIFLAFASDLAASKTPALSRHSDALSATRRVSKDAAMGVCAQYWRLSFQLIVFRDETTRQDPASLAAEYNENAMEGSVLFPVLAGKSECICQHARVGCGIVFLDAENLKATVLKTNPRPKSHKSEKRNHRDRAAPTGRREAAQSPGWAAAAQAARFRFLPLKGLRACCGRSSRSRMLARG